ncbi:glycosyltransferase family 1 protein [Hyphomicrobium sp.]|uniref:glycosyltransferase family 4 protein n=1 Tax=Hyphomicrobium sp. TaxID=82 RepID=UPI002D76AC94|nr:glycosyltransferase family 1 protein [Hyphomicrobium sp.]HET6389197.1 glycosyltransferase family 1 protein [Hyphomicrobium sp.]
MPSSPAVRRVSASRRIVIDITDWNRFLFAGKPISGVHRIALGLLRAWKELGLPFVIIRHDPETNRHRIISHRFIEEDFSEPIYIGGEGIKYSYNKYVQRRTRYYTELIKARLLRFVKKKETVHADFIEGDYCPQADDVLYFCGAGWDAPETMEAARKWKARHPGFRFVVLLHDCIPLIKKVYRNRLGTRQFRRWLRDAAGSADEFICISDSTKSDLMRYWPRYGGQSALRCKVVTNPHEFLAVSDRRHQPMPDEASSAEQFLAHRNRRYLLTVGTLSSHKNLERLLSAWAALNFFRDPEADLVIVGDNDLQQVRSLSPIRRNVFVFRKPPDDILELLYSNAFCSIFPSLYEGWGLPVGESLWFGKVCLCSDSSSITEVGQDMCPYFNPYSTEEILHALTRTLFEKDYIPSYEKRIDRRKMKSWAMYGSEIHTTLLKTA